MNAHCPAQAGWNLSLRSSHHHPCMWWTLLLIFSTLPFTSFCFIVNLIIVLFFLPDTLHGCQDRGKISCVFSLALWHRTTAPQHRSPVETRYESQIFLSSWTEQHPKMQKFVSDTYSSARKVNEQWPSHQWKSDEVMEVKTERCVNERLSRFVITAHGQIYCWWWWNTVTEWNFKSFFGHEELSSAKDVTTILERRNTKKK